eukprot:gb/GECG01005378.1/.p1 GENE.gb/GECG01005378.1/~~gb/GECG01005378.1/.p1  ORF type:complete len:753 (+),score=56.81 gb/GECG01005378.1/:1-2259(+)
MANAFVNKVHDPRADRIYADVQGQLSNENHPDIFGPELLPGETIIREFREFSIDEPRSCYQVIPLAFITCCMYLIYLYICACLRAFDVGNTRARLAFTDKGRLMLWTSDLSGKQGGIFNCFSQRYKSNTEMQWYHCKDINSFQFEIHRSSKLPIPGCDDCFGVEDRARLRIFFGKRYPKTSLLQELDSSESGAIQGINRPEWSRAKDVTGTLGQGSEDDNEGGGLIGSMLGLIPSCFNTVFTCLTCAKYYKPGRAIPLLYGARGEFSLTVESLVEEDTHDAYHDKPGEAWEELIELMRTLTIAKDPNALPNVEPNPSSFSYTTSQDMEDAKDTKLIQGPKPCVDYRKFPLIEGEEVLDALKIQPRMSWWECAFAWQWCPLCRVPKYVNEAAAILTTHRAFSCTEYRPDAGHYQFAMTAYFIEKLGGGMVVTDPDGNMGYSIDVSTKYGALRVMPVMSELWPWTALVPEKQKARMANFMHNLERACHTEKCIPAPAEGTLPNDDVVQEVLEYINLWDDEDFCSVIKSSNLYNMDPYTENFPWSCLFHIICCGDKVSMRGFIETIMCGCRPWRLDQYLVLTTHRLVSFQRGANNAMLNLCQGKANVLLWVPLTDIEGMKFNAQYVATPATCFTRMCAQVCRCCNDNSATLNVSLGMDASYKTAPFGVGRIQEHAESGLLEGRSDLTHFRAAFAYYQSDKYEIPKGDYLEPYLANERYGKTPWPEHLESEEGVSNPMIGSGGSPVLIGVGTSGGS